MMSTPKIILPGATMGKALLLPDHIVAQREQEREQRRRLTQLRQARVDMVNKAQDQLTQVSRQARAGKKLSAAQRREVNFLAGVATGGATRRERRQALRKMGLLSS